MPARGAAPIAILLAAAALGCAAADAPAQLDVELDHLSTFSDTGAITTAMLGPACTGTACCSGYAGACTSL
jgi:hypothetical protein